MRQKRVTNTCMMILPEWSFQQKRRSEFLTRIFIGRILFKNGEEKGFLRKKNTVNVEITEEKIQEHLITNGNGFRHLILIITDNCNLRCKYCIFSENYQLHRGYSLESMDFTTAKRAVDYYLKNFEEVQRRNPGRKPVIGFYGGEPLLNFDLIKEVVGYISNIGYKPFYNITTNGTLLSGEKLDFLVQNDFAISISFDGPKEEHDRNRVFSNGKGTFETVMKNIKEFKRKYPDYLKCGILSVYDLKTDFQKCKNFFDQNRENLPRILRVDPVKTQETSYYEQFTIEDAERSEKQLENLRKKWMKEVLPGKEILDYGGILFGVSYVNLLIRPIGKTVRSSLMPYTGACIPGNKIAVRPNGTINICERISDNFPIGNVQTGLDYGLIKSYLENYISNICKNCEECPVSRLCSLCFSQCAGERNFEKQPSNICEIIKEDERKKLAELYTLLESNPELYSKLSTNYYREIINRFQL